MGASNMRTVLLHVLPKGFHRIRHYGLLASGSRKAHLERARRLLALAPPTAVKIFGPETTTVDTVYVGSGGLTEEWTTQEGLNFENGGPGSGG